jgi:hypothetical protein
MDHIGERHGKLAAQLGQVRNLPINPFASDNDPNRAPSLTVWMRIRGEGNLVTGKHNLRMSEEGVLGAD